MTLGGSRAQGTATADSDWDFGLYYRGTIARADVEALGWPGRASEPHGWGPVVNGGAWLTVEGQRVDLCYKDLDEVLHWTAEAEGGRFRIEALVTHAVGIPTYVLAGELAVNEVLVGHLPRPSFPPALAVAAPPRWRQLASMSLSTAAAHARRGDVTATVANLGRAAIAEAHARLAASRQWVLNEKGALGRAGLGGAHEVLAAPGTTPGALASSVDRLAGVLGVDPAVLRP